MMVGIDAPIADHDLRFGETGELLDVEQLVAHAGVEALESGKSSASRGRREPRTTARSWRSRIDTEALG